MSQGDPAQEPLILDPQNVYFDVDQLCYRWEGETGAIDKVISGKDPDQLKHLAIKPLHGMSSKGVFVRCDLLVVEKYCSEEPMLAQEMFWVTPVIPNINEELSDPDARAGICSETRLVFHAGSPAVLDSPNEARCILALSRSHCTSKDPDRKTKKQSRRTRLVL